MKAKIKIIMAMIIWGSMGIFVRKINLPSAEIAVIRGFIGVIFLFLVSFISKIKFCRNEFLNNKGILIISGVALGANWIFLFEAYKHTTIAIATLSYYLAPIIITMASPFILKEKLTAIKVICIITALTGLALVSGVFTNDVHRIGSGLGILFGVIAAVLYASLTLMNKFIKDLNGMETTLAQLTIASLVLLPYAFFLRNPQGSTLGEQELIFLIILGIVHTGLAFWLFFSSVRDLKGQAIAVLSYIDPVTAILLSAFVLQERLSGIQIIGAGFILGSTFISIKFGNCNLKSSKKADFSV